MEVLQAIVNWVLDLGSNVFVPIIMFIIGMIGGLKFQKSFKAALTLGVAFSGMTLVVNYMESVITPAGKAMSKMMHVNLLTTDLGWTGVAAITWTAKVAFLFFPLLLLINFIMLAFNWTKTLNVDMWNVWNKIFTYVIVDFITGKAWAGLLVAILQIILELKAGDMWARHIKDMTGIEGITVPHFITLFAVVLMPLNKLLDFIPIFNKPFDAEHIQKKIGIWGQNDVMGFIIGILLGVGARYSVQKDLVLGVEAAAAMTLFPMISKLFMEALNPISDAMSGFMKRHFKNREVYIGVDWPILGGRPELWVTVSILVPVELIFAMILPGNTILPFAGIINLSFVNAGLLLTGGNVLRMIVLGIITTPVFLYGGTYFAPYITKLARQTGAVKVPAGTQISWSTFEGPDFRLFFSQAFNGKIWAIALAVVWIIGFIWLYRYMTTCPLPSQKYTVAGVDGSVATVTAASVANASSPFSDLHSDDYKEIDLTELDGQDFRSVNRKNAPVAVKATLGSSDLHSDSYKSVSLTELDGQNFKNLRRKN